MKTAKTAICAIIALAAASSQAFLGFGSSDKKPPKLHVLMQEANDYIEEAQVCELNGDGDKAIEFYKKALAELDKIVAENPERAETAEFAPLRNKAAVCAIQIDAIKLEQVNANERRVAVTDTTELQKKYDEKHGIKRPRSAKDLAKDETKPKEEAKEKDETKPKEEAKPKDEPKPKDEAKPKEESKEEPKPKDEAEAKPPEEPKPKEEPRPAQAASVGSHLEDAKDAIATGRYDDATKALLAALKMDPDNWDARYLLAYVHVAREDYEAADVLFVDILEDRPNDVSALLLHAAALMARGSYAAAQKSVASAIRAKPSYYAGYYDMATLLVEMGSSKETARKYYEAGRAQGGPRDAELEKLLK